MAALHFTTIPCGTNTANRHIESHILCEIRSCTNNIVYAIFERFFNFLCVFMNVFRVFVRYELWVNFHSRRWISLLLCIRQTSRGVNNVSPWLIVWSKHCYSALLDLPHLDSFRSVVKHERWRRRKTSTDRSLRKKCRVS